MSHPLPFWHLHQGQNNLNLRRGAPTSPPASWLPSSQFPSSSSSSFSLCTISSSNSTPSKSSLTSPSSSFSVANGTINFTFSPCASIRNPNHSMFSHYDSSLHSSTLVARLVTC
ncbi:hypothetical protein AAZX31_18G266500 [Glycine max]